MSAMKLLAGAVIVIGAINLADRPEVQSAMNEFQAEIRSGGGGASGGGDGYESVAASRASNFRTSSHAPAEARVQRALTPRVDTGLADLRRQRDEAYSWVSGAERRYGSGSYSHREAWAAYQRADAAYNAALERSGAW